VILFHRNRLGAAAARNGTAGRRQGSCSVEPGCRGKGKPHGRRGGAWVPGKTSTATPPVPACRCPAARCQRVHCQLPAAWPDRSRAVLGYARTPRTCARDILLPARSSCRAARRAECGATGTGLRAEYGRTRRPSLDPVPHGRFGPASPRRRGSDAHRPRATVSSVTDHGLRRGRMHALARHPSCWTPAPRSSALRWWASLAGCLPPQPLHSARRRAQSNAGSTTVGASHRSTASTSPRPCCGVGTGTRSYLGLVVHGQLSTDQTSFGHVGRQVRDDWSSPTS
jgi:hypothetical protein